MDVYFITGNKYKLKEAGQILGFKPKSYDLDLMEIQSLDAKDTAQYKARQAWQLIKKPIVVWDQSLYISCFNGFPGPLIKWFWTQVTLAKICEMAKNFGDQKIKTQTILTYFDGKTLRHFYGLIHGRIPDNPLGNNGFAWDPIFIPRGYKQTFAQMSAREKNAMSMHKIALEKLSQFLSDY